MASYRAVSVGQGGERFFAVERSAPGEIAHPIPGRYRTHSEAQAAADQLTEAEKEPAAREPGDAALPPRPANAVFGIEADGKLMSPGFPHIAQAEAAAVGLFRRGYSRIEIVDRVTGQ